MNQIQFGDYILETSIEKMDLQDLHSSKLNKLAGDIMLCIKEQVLADMREAINKGNIPAANQSEGYLTAIEDLVEFFEVHLQESLKSEVVESHPSF